MASSPSPPKRRSTSRADARRSIRESSAAAYDEARDAGARAAAHFVDRVAIGQAADLIAGPRRGSRASASRAADLLNEITVCVAGAGITHTVPGKTLRRFRTAELRGERLSVLTHEPARTD